jgi:hypothetical protein
VSTLNQRYKWLIWGIAIILLLVVSMGMGNTPLTETLRERLTRRSSKAKIARTALAQEEQDRALRFSPAGGYYDHDLAVELHVDSPNKILFTTDGSTPTFANGILYEQPIYLDSQSPRVVALRTREVLTGTQLGPVVSASYVLGVRTQLPVLSLIIDPSELQDLDTHYLSRGQAWERNVHLTYITPDRQVGFTQAAGLRIRGNGMTSLPKKSFWIYFRQEYGKGKLSYPLFGDGDVHTFDRLVLDGGGTQREADKSLRWTLMESELTAQLTRDIGGIAPQGQYVVLFINGQPWGIYDLRERLDQHFVNDHFNVQDADLIENHQAQSGDLDNWNALNDFVANHSLADPQNFEFVQTQMDLQDFTDYNIIQIFAAHDDWPQENAVRARARVPGGRWFWMSWDATRGYGVTGNTSFDAVEWAMHSYALTQHESSAPLRATLLLRSLLENDGYRAAFLARAADLLNTTLSAGSVAARIDRTAAQLASDMHLEQDRWPSVWDWQTNVQDMRAWTQARPDQMRQELMRNFELTGTVTLEFAPPSAGKGYVTVDGLLARQLPWQGVYFAGCQVQVLAIPEPGYVFAGWDASELTTANITLTVSVTRTLTPRFAPARPDAPRPNDAIFDELWINDNGTRYASLGGRPIEGDWFELLVVRDKLDMRGWRVTDNDTKTATDEGSLIFPRAPAFAAVPRGTVILVIATENETNAANFPRDDLDASDGRMILYVGNGTLDAETDPGFGIGRSNDNLALLAPRPTGSFADDVGIDFVAEGSDVTPVSFGVLTDGVVFEHPFRGVGNDNGAVFTFSRQPGRMPFDNDDADDPTVGDDQPGLGGWIVDPGKMYTGDDPTPGAKNILTPGQLNPGQAWTLFWNK